MTSSHPDVPRHLADLADSGVVSSARLAATLLRYEYTGGEEMLARMASRGRYGVDELTGMAAEATAGRAPDAKALAPLHGPSLYGFAYLMLGRAFGTDGDFRTAADLFALARTIADRDGNAYEYDRQDVQSHLAVGRVDYVRRHTSHANPDVRTNSAESWYHWAVNTDIINPFRGVEPASLETWQQAFNAPFIDRGLDPMRFEATDSPFDTVRTDAPAGSVDGPLISIVMPVYSPTESLLTATRSILEQTWGNIEIILVDDHSPAGFEDIFARATALDDRVSYHRMPVNGGAYRARNYGLSLAKGEFFGIQDGDDWSHPRRLERQMAEFADPKVVATLSKAIRLHTDLYITRVGSLAFAHSAPSLIARRELVLGTLGPFDLMRKGADTEYIERIATVFGRDSVVNLKMPLSLYQLTGGSLSREDFRPSWHRPARATYHSAFRHWHAKIAAGLAVPRTPDADGRRAFPAPPDMEGTEYADLAPDVVVLTDPRPGPLAYTGVADEVAAIAGAGLTIGIARADALRFSSRQRHYPRADLLELMYQRVTDWALLGAPMTPKVLLVRDVDLVTLPRASEAVAMRPERVVVVADRLPVTGDGPRVSWDPVHVESVVRTMFDVATEWIPATAEIAAAITAAGATGIVHPPRLMEVARVARFPRRLLPGTPVVGIADAASYRVESADRRGLARIVPREVDLRVLEGEPRKPVRADALGFDAARTPATAFYDQCDIVIVPPTRTGGSTLLRPAIEAMARGCVVIVDPALRPLLGDAALYLDDPDAEHLVTALTTEPARFAEQQQRSLRFCETVLSPDTYATAVTALVSPGGSR
ncbi:glycosyltransferase family A protein [Aeromicrobium wangtongii]|uniref:glycosyltransferase family A protein n=1 Tax=Aeromicrobium wangtongii TaxID=2969247 RepID=UPI001E511CE1|nr:glycosyltransferase family A protein [Aeromicrobium wangtongii]MCD9199749.1 glycosyltransferase [Aeromicrobium wangtongii]